jgi:NAD(P)-dependent dehydrogenase (short-subunit alcohol dehydrogenase family)
MAKVDGKVAIITGGARGQGRAHAVALAREGADVVVCDAPPTMDVVPYETASQADLDETVRLVEETGALRRRRRRRARPGRARGVRRHSRERVRARRHPVRERRRARVRAAARGRQSGVGINIAVNLGGVYNTVRAVLPTMLERGSGRIIATSSAGGRIGYPNLTAYCAAKWGVIGLVKSLALEVAPPGLTVNAIVPGMVDSA